MCLQTMNNFVKWLAMANKTKYREEQGYFLNVCSLKFAFLKIGDWGYQVEISIFQVIFFKSKP